MRAKTQLDWQQFTNCKLQLAARPCLLSQFARVLFFFAVVVVFFGGKISPTDLWQKKAGSGLLKNLRHFHFSGFQWQTLAFSMLQSQRVLVLLNGLSASVRTSQNLLLSALRLMARTKDSFQLARSARCLTDALAIGKRPSRPPKAEKRFWDALSDDYPDKVISLKPRFQASKFIE